jgi:transposase
VKFDSPVQQIVLQEYLDTVKAAQRWVTGLEAQMHEALAQWSLRPVLEGLMALRGVSLITTMTTLAKLGDITSFDSPRELMAYSAWCPASTPAAARAAMAGLAAPATGMCGECR